MIHCSGGECPFKETCNRFVAEKKEGAESFPFPPFAKNDSTTSGFSCMNWWPLPGANEPPKEKKKKFKLSLVK